MALDISHITKLETFILYTEVLDATPKTSFTLEELAKFWGVDVNKAKTIVRKLRREGFLKRTKSGKYKPTLAGQVLVKLYKRVKK